jgi:tryptophanyl-tRNA synthetase
LDDGINSGLFLYPALMAADILLFDTNFVPVGLDQKQHIEISRDIAQAVNNNYGDVLVLPEAVIKQEVMTIPGLDGRKMSKSYDNVIPMFAESNKLRRSVMRIVTDSRRPEEPKDPETDNVFAIYKHFAEPEDIERMRQGYIQGGMAYSQIKSELYELLEERFAEPRQRYEELMQDWGYLDQVLRMGAEKARKTSVPKIAQLRKAIGIE